MADRVNKEQFGSLITDQQLFEMATKNPSEIAGLDDKVGSIAVGKAADLLVVKGDASHAYRAIIDAKPQDVMLTTIGGQVFYGDEKLVEGTGTTREFETVDACGTTRLISSDVSTERSITIDGMALYAPTTDQREGFLAKVVHPPPDADAAAQARFVRWLEPGVPNDTWKSYSSGLFVSTDFIVWAGGYNATTSFGDRSASPTSPDAGFDGFVLGFKR